jgi:hypothetical protein
MSERSKPVLVMAGSYGILRSPAKEGEAAALATVDVSINYPTALISANGTLGMFTVIDVPSHCSAIFDTAANLFRSHSVVKLQTTNLQGQLRRTGQTLGKSIKSGALREAADFFTRMTTSLEHQGITVNTEHLEDPPPPISNKPEDRMNAVIFTLENGIQVIRNGDLFYDKEQVLLEESTRYQSIMKSFALRQTVQSIRYIL